MTGTAHTEANEFKQIYKLDCVVMPTNRPLRRENNVDCVYKSVREKYAAVVEEIVECNKKGQPVLVGTISIEKSEILSAMLKQRGVEHQVLNAKYHELEAQIVAQAGRYKAVTIATNMAGRGTDIVLGGNAEFLAKALTEHHVQSKKSAGEEVNRDELTQKFLAQFREQCRKEHEQVIDVGGLHVLGTERHESRRIDNQLRGRSGRQGDPGSSRFYVSLEDDLMRLFASGRIMGMMDKLGMEEGQVIEHPWVSRAIEVAQKRVEAQNFEFRKQLLEYDDVMNKQREAIYGLRRDILESDHVKDRIIVAVEDTVPAVIAEYHMTEGEEVKWDIEGLDLYLKSKFNFDLGTKKDEIPTMTRDDVREFLTTELKRLYDLKEQEIPAEHLRRLEKFMLLNVLDAKWKDHLYAMDQLKGGVGLRAYGQRDPLVEFKREGFAMFQGMYDSINRDVVETIFRIKPAPDEHRPRGVFSSLPQNLVHQEAASFTPPPATSGMPADNSTEEEAPEPKGQTYEKTGPKVGRNDPCPCGSGKKYKKCCGK